MARKKPVVLGDDGNFQVLQSGDQLETPAFDPSSLPGPFGFYFRSENLDLPIIPAGGAVAFHVSGFGVILAVAALIAKACVGLCRTQTFTANPAYIQTAGLFQLADWTSIVGTATLASRTTYFLDPVNPGKLTATPPTTPGQFLQVVGRTVLPDTLEIKLGNPILL